MIDHLTSGGKHDVPAAQRVFWAVIEGVIAAVLLIGGGLAALQTASITAGLPFSFVLLLMCYTVYVGLGNELRIMESEAFAEWIERLDERESVVVEDGRTAVTDVDDVDPSPGGD